MIKYKVFAILVLFFYGFCGFLACSKNPVKNPPRLKFESSQSDCKGSFSEKTGGTIPSGGVIIFSSHSDTIVVIHQNAFYNCCSKIKVNLKATPNGFDLLEYDVGDACKCMCYFDITTTISDVSPGTYLIRVFDTDTNLVGSGVLDIPSKYTGSESFQSKCKNHLLKTVAEAISNTLEDSILVWFHADTAWVMHKNDPELCDSKIGTKIERTLKGFDIHEYFIYEGSAYCVCYFDITTTIYGLSPGGYLIRVFDTTGDLVGEVELVIPSKVKNKNNEIQKVIFA
jgi:uncharacterized protein (DUF2141 family)